MVVDLALWMIFAATIGLIVCGCIYTAPDKVDRAA
jgi:hypothetical protein